MEIILLLFFQVAADEAPSSLSNYLPSIIGLSKAHDKLHTLLSFRGNNADFLEEALLFISDEKNALVALQTLVINKEEITSALTLLLKKMKEVESSMPPEKQYLIHLPLKTTLHNLQTEWKELPQKKEITLKRKYAEISELFEEAPVYIHLEEPVPEKLLTWAKEKGIDKKIEIEVEKEVGSPEENLNTFLLKMPLLFLSEEGMKFTLQILQELKKKNHPEQAFFLSAILHPFQPVSPSLSPHRGANNRRTKMREAEAEVEAEALELSQKTKEELFPLIPGVRISPVLAFNAHAVVTTTFIPEKQQVFLVKIDSKTKKVQTIPLLQIRNNNIPLMIPLKKLSSTSFLVDIPGHVLTFSSTHLGFLKEEPSEKSDFYTLGNKMSEKAHQFIATNPHLIAFLIQTFKDEDPNVRRNVAEALRKIDPEAKEVVPALIALLKDEDPNVRWSAAEALGNIGPEAKEAVPALIAIASLKDETPYVRWTAVEALGKIGKRAKLTQQEQESIIQALREFSFDQNEDLKENIQSLLEEIKNNPPTSFVPSVNGTEAHFGNIHSDVFSSNPICFYVNEDC